MHEYNEITDKARLFKLFYVVQLAASEAQQLICGDDVNVCKLLGKKGISGFHYGDWRRSQARCSAK